MSEKSISEIIEEVKVEMCKKYCKFYSMEDDEKLDEICADCALGRL